jgi:adhesin/invasin
VSPAVKEGLPAPATPPLSTTVNPVTVTIGGKAAQVAFSGLTPGYAGLYQVNAVVPAGITTGDAVPVVVSVAGQTSPVVTMAVR